MGLVFESVLYSQGTIGEDSEPKFFTDMHYDNEISPLGLGAAGSQPPPNVEASGATIRGTVNVFDKFFDGNYEGGVASLIDGVLSGDGGRIKDHLVTTTRNLGSAIISGDNITDVYNFPASISGPLQNVQDLFKPVRAAAVGLNITEPGTNDLKATSNNKGIADT